MEPTSFAVSDALYLTSLPVSGKEPAKPKEVPTNHLAVIDCSGSMSCDLPKIREQLKKKLPKLLREKDTISIIWFSGRGQFGALLEAEPVATLTDLKDVEQAIDRWLRPTGLTGFKEPLEEVSRLVDRVAKKTPGNAFSLFFISDGCDNQWPRPDILKAVEKAGSSVASATFVEYGYYADRPLLTQMAEKSGGTLIFAEDFDRYVPAFEAAIQKRQSGAKRVEVKIPGDVIGGFAYAFSGSDLLTFAVEAGAAQVPEDTKEIWFLSPAALGTLRTDAGGKPDAVHYQAAYAALSLYAQRMRSDVVLALLKSTGDVRFIKKFSGLFGKQKYSEFVDEARLAAIEPSLRLVQGYDPKLVPPDDAFTVLDLLLILSEDDGNKVLLDSPDFKYSRIGRGRLDSAVLLNEEEQKEVDELTAKIGTERNAKKIAEHAARIATITVGKESLKFEAYPAPDGYSISNLVFNEDRPNVSIQVRRPGKVDISGKVPEALKDMLPKEVDTSIIRNYAILKDGLVNVKVLPVRLTKETRAKLEAAKGAENLFCDHDSTDGSSLLSLESLPVINRKMVGRISAKEFFEHKYELLKLKAVQKVYNAYVAELLPAKKAEGLEKYGTDGAAWLKEQGFTDSTFAPKSVQAESTDFYMSKELKVSLKGLSSLPSLKGLRAAVAKGKLNPAALLMKATYDEVEAFLASDIYSKAAAKDKVLEVWLSGQAKATKNRVRELIYFAAQTTFTLIVGQVWFSDLPTLDDTTMTIEVDGQKVDCSVVTVEKEVKI